MYNRLPGATLGLTLRWTKGPFIIYGRGGGGGMGDKMGGPEILATAKRGSWGKFLLLRGGLEILNR